MKGSSWAGPLLIIILMIFLLWPGFGDVFLHPNGYLFARDGDGLKNYFNLGYYLKYDTGIRFSGVNYPYGENLLFTDTQPIYAILLNLIDDHLWSVANNSVAIINLTILCGMVFTGFILFLILRHYNLPAWYSLVIAICITFLSPQWDRIHGHLSLSFSFVIPSIWYLIIRYKKSNAHKLLWLLFIFFAGLVIAGLHLYYIAMTSGFILTLITVQWIAKMRQPTGKASFDWKLGMAALAPLIIALLVSKMTDTVSDRPISPYGFYVYHASLESIFLPPYAASNQFLQKLFQPSINWEGRAFIGSASLFFVVGVLVSWILQIIRNTKKQVQHLGQDLPLYAYAALILLLFSMCIPFEWLRFIPEFITPMKQFRARGRLAWVFYYVINVTAAVYLFRIFMDLKLLKVKLAWTYSFILTIILMWIFDAGSFYLNHGPVSIAINDKLENHSESYLAHFTTSGHRPEDFQAIFGLPLVAVRTDKMTLGDNMSAHNEAMKCAFHTGLPIIQSSASRPSLGQTLSSIQLISSPMIRKSRLEDMDTRPLLLLYTVGSELKPTEKVLLNKGILFWEDSFIQLYKLPLAAFEDSLDYTANYLDLMQSDSLDTERKSGMVCFPDCNGIIFNSYEESVYSRSSFYGKNALTGKTKVMTVLDTSYLVDSTLQKEISFWIYIDPAFSGMPAYEYFFGPDADHLTSRGKKETRDIPEIDNGWVRISLPLEAGGYHRLYLYGKNTTIDNLLIRRLNQDTYLINGKQRLFNNYLID